MKDQITGRGAVHSLPCPRFGTVAVVPKSLKELAGVTLGYPIFGAGVVNVSVRRFNGVQPIAEVTLEPNRVAADSALAAGERVQFIAVLVLTLGSARTEA